MGEDTNNQGVTPEYVEIEWSAFEEQFKPQKNHFDDNASLDGFMFETYDEELEFVQSIFKKVDPNRVWTYIGDGEETCIVNGYHWCNRMGYLVTELPATPNAYISVID